MSDAQSLKAARICELNAKPLRAVDDWLRDYEDFWRP